MYTLVGARAKRDRRAGRYEPVDVANVSVRTLRVTHGDVWLFITYLNNTEPKALRFDLMAGEITTLPPSMTVQQWLTSLGNQTLPFADEVPTFTPRFVRYANAWHAGYTIQPVTHLGQAPNTGSDFDKYDLLLSKEGHEPVEIGEYAMVTVNGLFHILDYNTVDCRVISGNRSLRIANDNEIGIHSFKEIGKLKYVPITPDMVNPQNASSPLHDGAYITMPNSIDIENKTVMVVIGGYLHTLSGVFKNVADRVFKVELSRMSLLERYYDSCKRMDLSSLGLTQYDHNPELLSMAELQSDDVIRAYLTLDQSFLVVVEAETLFQQIDPLEYTYLPGRWLDYEFEKLPVMGAYGRMVEYHPINEDGITVIAGCENKQHRYGHYSRRLTSTGVVDSSRQPHAPFEHVPAFTRRIGTE